MTKITIERETLKWAIRWHESRIWPGPDEVSVFDALRAALAQKAEPYEQEVALQKIADFGQDQEPVAWRHSETGQLYDSEEEVPLADGDEWAEPLYAAPATQQAPAAWRQWSSKLHDWDYQTNRGDLRPDTPADPLFVAAAQPAPAAVPPGYALVPIEPTHGMLSALTQEWHPSKHGPMKQRYRAMIAAAGDKP